MKIGIEPGNPHDFTRAELNEVAELVRAEQPDADVHICVRPERGYGVTDYEVLKLVIEAAGVTVGGLALVQKVIEWCAKRWKNDLEATGRPRRRSVMIYDANGRPVKHVRIQEPDGVPIVEDPGETE
jgi:hypothetical protein